MDEIPLLINDYMDKAVIEPHKIADTLLSKHSLSMDDIPTKCILSFKYTGLEKILKIRYKAVKRIPDIGGDIPLYVFEVDGSRYCYSNLCIGGPCSALVLETLYALNVDEAVYIGSVGTLKKEIKPYDVIISERAIRDEGTSYHYLPPSIYVDADLGLYSRLKDALKENKYRVYEGVIWTTDAAFRETWARRDAFIKLGAIAVDMEAASLYALAKYRRKKIVGIYFPIDLLSDDGWMSYIENYRGLKYIRFIHGLFKIAIDVLRE
jgi:purine-nucleoside phosphorylase